MTSRNVPFVRTDSGDPGAEAINASERHHVATAGHAGETARAETSTSATSVDQLAAMFQMFLIQQQERDEMWRKEAGKQEQRWRSLQHQFSQLQQVTQGERRLAAEESRATEQGVRTRILRHGGESTSGETRVYASSQDRAEPHAASSSTPRMPELKVSDDIENYLAMFERVAQTAGWPPEDWAIHLVPALDGKAREAYIAMDAADICNYVKQAHQSFTFTRRKFSASDGVVKVAVSSPAVTMNRAGCRKPHRMPLSLPFLLISLNACLFLMVGGQVRIDRHTGSLVSRAVSVV
ncbi:hypothetical protein MHYP_G00357470 [Metynnis hypsauchen]